jgi:ABC-2 type transport system permease protein
MTAIAVREYLSLLRGFKSFVIICLISLFSAYIADFIKTNISLLQGDGIDLASGGSVGLRFIIYFLGFLIIMVYSHDVINREIDSQRIRLLVTKTTRTSIVFGKTLGIWLYWSTVIAVAFLIVSVITMSFSLLELTKLLAFIFYPISLTLFLSTLFRSTRVSNLLAIFLGLALPILGIYSLISSNVYVSWIKYVLPYYPLLMQPVYLFIPALFTIAIIIANLYIFERKEL